MYKTIYSYISHLYFSQVPSAGIGLFRIFFGLVTLQEIIFLLYFNHLIFDPIPYMDVEFPMIPFFLCLWAIIACFVSIGYRCQQSIITNYIFWIVFVNFTPMQRDFDGGFDLFMIGSNFFLIFMPISKSLSIDNLRIKLQTPFKHYSLHTKEQASLLCYFIPLLVCLGFMYFDSAIHKMFAPHWRNGLGSWLPATMPYYISPLNTSWLLNIEYLQKTIGYTILVFQFSFVFFFNFSKLRTLFLLVGLGLHLGILITLNIYPFGFAMLIFYILLIPFSWYKNILQLLTPKKPKLTVFYDEQCPLCCKTILTLNHFDIFNSIDFKGAQTYAIKFPLLSTISEATLLTDLYALNTKSKLFSGVETYAQILIKMGYPAILGYLIKLPLINYIVCKIYRNIADSRTRITCDASCDTKKIEPLPLSFYDNLFKQPSNKESKRKIHKICKIIIMIFILQLNSSLHYGLVYRLDLHDKPNSLSASIASISNNLTLFSTTFLGITPHALYLHDHFEGYNHLIAITYDDAQGNEKWLPFVSPDGRLLSPNWGRVHSMWANIAVTPNIDNARLSKFIMKTTSFWGIKSGLELNKTVFNIKLKKIISPETWSNNLLSKNLNAPWATIGSANWHNSSFNLTIPTDINFL